MFSLSFLFGVCAGFVAGHFIGEAVIKFLKDKFGGVK